jgi:glycosyltransferase involved in cell wall biosynthesis
MSGIGSSATRKRGKNTLRILIVEPDLTENGAIRVTLDRGARWTHSSEVALLVTSPDTRGQAAGVAVPNCIPVHFGGPPSRRRMAALIASVVQGIRLAKKSDVIVAGREIGNGLFVAAMIAAIARRPLAVTVQSNVGAAIEAYLPPRQKYLTRQIYRRVDLAVCVSAGLTPSVTELGVPGQRVEVVLNGLDTNRVRKMATSAPSVELPSGRFIAAVGRLVHQKGFDVLIRAHAAALASGAATHSVVIVGNGPLRGELTALAAELGVEDTVFFAGFIENPHAITARAEAYISSSRWEGFSLVVAEALALGVPVIASDCVSGPAEILGHGAFGELVPVDDPDALAQAIQRHLEAPSVLKQKSAAGSEGVEERFSLDKAADQHRDLLERLAAGHANHVAAPA